MSKIVPDQISSRLRIRNLLVEVDDGEVGSSAEVEMR